jgi:hypothetical protein
MWSQISSLHVTFRSSAAHDPLSLWEEMLARDFPAVAFAGGAPPRGLPGLPLSVERWESQSFNFYALDGRLDALAERGSGPFAIVLHGEHGGHDGKEELARVARQVLTRCQRWMDRRNEASRTPLFDRILRRHRELHDLAKPLVRADYDHALDTWQWLLRLAPEAGLAEQLAALLHDVERLVSEADFRVEQRAADYQAFKEEHAARGAEMADALLAAAGCDGATCERAVRLIAGHEKPPAADEGDSLALSLLNDADALSFFSLNSVGYLDYYGPEQARRKVGHRLHRLDVAPAQDVHHTGQRLAGERPPGEGGRQRHHGVGHRHVVLREGALREERHRLAGLEPLDVRPQPGDLPPPLVAGLPPRQRIVEPLPPLEDRQVRGADTTPPQPHQHLPRTRDRRSRLLQLNPARRRNHSHLHGVPAISRVMPKGYRRRAAVAQKGNLRRRVHTS